MEINFEALAKLQGISIEEARELYEESLAETRRAAEAFLGNHPELLKEFESEYERDTALQIKRGLPPPEREAYLRGCALRHQTLDRVQAQLKRVKASDVAAAFNGELPPGWDDMLPPDCIDTDIRER